MLFAPHLPEDIRLCDHFKAECRIDIPVLHHPGSHKHFAVLYFAVLCRIIKCRQLVISQICCQALCPRLRRREQHHAYTAFSEAFQIAREHFEASVISGDGMGLQCETSRAFDACRLAFQRRQSDHGKNRTCLGDLCKGRQKLCRQPLFCLSVFLHDGLSLLAQTGRLIQNDQIFFRSKI